MATVDIAPAETTTALNGAVDAGQHMEEAATEAQVGSTALEDALAGAPTASQAFSEFWSRFGELPTRAASTVHHQASCVGRAVATFVTMDEAMSSSAQGALPSAAASNLQDLKD
ncbi:hypothetical protein HDA30_001640 [Micrococcus cohnii]|uniref:Uncharacterized protein n=1 Tax=Micrococcus cohnii TaxID=993416 RepID=A0A7W7GPY8_9MICC|nr:hypothetical protein [Micrococcus cohnii]MBB4736132.1 hypothetical protein [Micrococcus cohnii]